MKGMRGIKGMKGIRGIWGRGEEVALDEKRNQGLRRRADAVRSFIPHSPHSLHSLPVTPSLYPNRPVMYSSVCCFAGFEKIVSVGPCSTSSPRSMTAVQSDTRAACCRLWVTVPEWRRLGKEGARPSRYRRTPYH